MTALLAISHGTGDRAGQRAVAGIPLTHRGLATAFTGVTAHDQIPAIGGGRDHPRARRARPGVRAAIVEDGFGDRQRVTVGTLGTIAQQAAVLVHDLVGVTTSH